MSELKPEHKMAADFYLSGHTKKAALLKAGYAESVARKPFEVFGRDDVAEYIMAARDELAKRTMVTKERLVAKLWEIANAQIGDYVEDDGSLSIEALGPSERTALQNVKVTESRGGKKYSKTKRVVEVKNESKIAAMQLISKIMGFEDNSVKVSVEKELLDAMNRGFGGGSTGSE